MSSSSEEITEVFDALHAVVSRACELSFDVLTTPERLGRVCYVGPGQCNICGSRVRFRTISWWFGGMLARRGFPYSLDDFETLTHRRYLCPVCGSADRDRLYKLYADRFLRPDGVRRVLEFAPSAPVSA